MKNKKTVIIAFAILVVAILLCFAFCNRNEEAPATPTEAPTAAPTEAPTETPTETPAPTEPEWELGIARATFTEAIYSWLNKGDEVDIIGKFEHYYIISGEKYDLLIDEYYVRLSTEEEFESWDGYARPDTNVFDSVYRYDEPIAQLTTNTEVKVLEGKGNWLFIQWDDGEGYVKASDISKTKLTTGGGGGGGSYVPNDGTDVDVGLLSATQSQGQVVRLGAYYGPDAGIVYEKNTGVILADGIEAYVYLFDYNDEIKVIDHDDEYCTVYLDHESTAKIHRQFVKLEGDEVEDSWTGFSHSDAVVYEEFQRRDEVMRLKLNTEVVVLYKLPGLEYEDEGIYVVLINGEDYYMIVSEVSKDKIKPAAGGNGGNGGGGNVWTPPAL